MSSSGLSRLATWRDADEREGEVLKCVMTDNEGAKKTSYRGTNALYGN